MSMHRQSKISRRFGTGLERTYIVTYAADSPERSEAVSYFQQFERGLAPAMNLPYGIDDLPLDQAQQHLNENPIQQQWRNLTIMYSDPVADEDLRRLQFIPELKSLYIRTGLITDRGIEHLKWLTQLESLELGSAKVTNACLSHIINLKMLQTVDMQSASHVTRDAYLAAMARLPNLGPKLYPPFAPIAMKSD